MARQAIAFSSNEQRSLPLDAARLVNFFPEQPPLGSRAPALQVGISSPLKAVLYGTPGQSAFATAGSGKVRAMRYALGYLWALVDSALYRIDSDGTVTACTGDAIDPTGDAMMSDNGVQIVVLANGSTYVAGNAVASFSFRITGGSLSAGTNKISSITVDGVTITSGAVDWTTTNEQTALNVAANINAYASTPEYSATANADTVTISAASDTGATPNGYAVVVTIAGDVTAKPSTSATTSTGALSGGTATPTTVTLVSSDGYPAEGASSVDFLDGYMIWSRAGTKQFFLSALYDATTIDASDFASAESTPANLARVIVSNAEMWAFKDQGLEVWVDTGASPFPLERIPGARDKRGIAAPLSAVDVDGSVFWLADDLIVYRSQGYTPTRISEHGLEEIIRKGAATSIISDAFGMTYSQGGHKFYVLSFPTLGRTFVHDATSPSWHERQTGTSLVPAVWGVNCLCQAFGDKIYAGTTGGKISVLDLDTYTDNGDPIRRVAVTSPLYGDGKRSIMPTIEVECELGVGLTSGQGADPQVMLRWSDDGGATWSNVRSASMGVIGERKKRVIFRRLGSFRQRMFEVSISDPVKTAAYALRLEGMALAA
jgi:hypothetical protein